MTRGKTASAKREASKGLGAAPPEIFFGATMHIVGYYVSFGKVRPPSVSFTLNWENIGSTGYKNLCLSERLQSLGQQLSENVISTVYTLGTRAPGYSVQRVSKNVFEMFATGKRPVRNYECLKSDYFEKLSFNVGSRSKLRCCGCFLQKICCATIGRQVGVKYVN